MVDERHPGPFLLVDIGISDVGSVIYDLFFFEGYLLLSQYVKYVLFHSMW